MLVHVSRVSLRFTFAEAVYAKDRMSNTNRAKKFNMTAGILRTYEKHEVIRCIKVW